MSGVEIPAGVIHRRALPPAGWRRACFIGALYWLVLAPFTVQPKLGGGVWSRYLTIESLVERQTFCVDASPLLAASGTPDLIQVDGRLYSDKPPVLSVLAAAIYAPLNYLGVRFASSPGGFRLVNFVLTWLTAGLASAVAVAAVRRTFDPLRFSPFSSDCLALAFGFGTLLLTYGVTFNNHSVATGLIAMALALMLIDAGERPMRPGRPAFLGALAGLAAVIDLPAGGAMLVACAAWVAWRNVQHLLIFVGAALAWLVLHAVLQSMIVGSPLPVEFFPELFQYEGSYWASEAGQPPVVSRWHFALELLWGPQGWLTITPVMGLGLLGLAGALARGERAYRPLAVVVSLVLAAVLIFYVGLTRRTDFAGASFGTRHLLAVSPLVYFFSVWLLHRVARAWLSYVFVALTLVGTVYAMHGAERPWTRIEKRREFLLDQLQSWTLYPWSSYPR